MLFNSWSFLVLLIATFVIFYSVPKCKYRYVLQSCILLIASTIFYGWEDWRLLGLLAISCGGNAFASLQILACKAVGNERSAKRWVFYAVVLNLLLLGTFKYAGLLVSTIPGIPNDVCNWVTSIPLPIGISFYTFHGISMVVDIGRGRVQAYNEPIREQGKFKILPRCMRDMALYLLFFPQLIAGPIIKAHFFWPQLKSKLFSSIQWGRAFRYIVTGYFFKMVIADNLSTVTQVLKMPSYVAVADSFSLIMMLLGYSVQIFADFAGYSMIAIGLAALFGYRFPINFNFPYISKSLTEFWRRWNMTLSAWLRDYLYIPLGGSRCGVWRTYLNLFIVMFLGGLWHGADWKFALWGGLHGLVLALERLITKREWWFGKRIPNFIKISYACFIVCCLWTTFLMPDIETVGLFFYRVFIVPDFSLSMNATLLTYYNVLFFSAFVLLYHVYGYWRENSRHGMGFGLRHPRLSGVIYGFMIFMILTNSGPQAGFVYFQF